MFFHEQGSSIAQQFRNITSVSLTGHRSVQFLLHIPFDFTFPFNLSCKWASFKEERDGSRQMRYRYRVQLVALAIGSLKMHAAQ